MYDFIEIDCDQSISRASIIPVMAPTICCCVRVEQLKTTSKMYGSILRPRMSSNKAVLFLSVASIILLASIISIFLISQTE